MVQDFELDSGVDPKIGGEHGPYFTRDEAVRLSKDRWAHLGVAAVESDDGNVCEPDGSPLSRIVEVLSW